MKLEDISITKICSNGTGNSSQEDRVSSATRTTSWNAAHILRSYRSRYEPATSQQTISVSSVSAPVIEPSNAETTDRSRLCIDAANLGDESPSGETLRMENRTRLERRVKVEFSLRPDQLFSSKYRPHA